MPSPVEVYKGVPYRNENRHHIEVQASTNCACQIKAFNDLFLKVPAIFHVFLYFGTMCLLDNLADSAICGGLEHGNLGSLNIYFYG